MITLVNVSKTYKQGFRDVPALRGVSLRVEKGEFLSVMGSSGSGKSTLLNMMGGLDQPTSGEVFIDGAALHGMADDALTIIRRRKVGFVFQFFNLLPILTAAENVGLPLLLDGQPAALVHEKAVRLLEKAGLGDRTGNRPDQLSGGEMQRVAICRALITEPAVLLADEPTGNLDSRTSADILDMMKQLNRDGQTIVMVTHNSLSAGCGSRLITLKDGQVAEDVSLGRRAS